MPVSELEEIRWAKSDCIEIGLIKEDDDNNVQLTLTGEEFISNQLTRPRVFRDFLLSLDYIDQYLAQIEAKEKSHLVVLKNTIGDTGFTEETWLWRSKILANWLDFSGIILRSSGKIIVSTQIELFDNYGTAKKS